MKQSIQTFIASVLAVIFVVIPVFSASLPTPKPIKAITTISTVKKPDPIKPIVQPTPVPIQEPAPAPVAPPPPPTPPAPAPAPQTYSGCVTGYSTNDYYLNKIIAYESGGSSCATNPGGCFGLLQACPGYPLREACGGDAACQIEWFQTNKTDGRSWAQVWQHEEDFGWW